MNRWQKTIFLLLLISFIFLRFWHLGERNIFAWDQLDNAWVAKTMIVDHRFPLNGMVAKASTGFYIGPVYYYLITPFYLFFDLDPIASGIFAGLSAIVFFLTLFLVMKKLFSLKITFLAIFLNTFSFAAIEADRLQWPVNFLPLASLLIFYFLYKLVSGKEKYLIPLSLVLGFSFHLHFTAVFFPIIIFLSLPLFPKTRKLIKYLLISIPLFLIWFLPTFISFLLSSNSQVTRLGSYLSFNYHGFHMVRLFQLAGDAFLQFDKVLGSLPFNNFWLRFILLIIFFLTYYLGKTKNRSAFLYLIFLWFIVPWLVFTTYSGEISDYYFTISYPLVLIIISFLLGKFLESKYLLSKSFLIIFLLFFGFLNLEKFFKHKNRGMDYYRATTLEKIQKGEKKDFCQGDPESYFYYYYTRR